MKKFRLFTPVRARFPKKSCRRWRGPSPPPDDWFKGYMKAATEKLQQVLCTKHEVIIITGSGTAAAEAGIVGVNGPGSKLLTVEAGSSASAGARSRSSTAST